MNVKQLKKAAKRIDVNYLQQLGIQSYGDDNLYPQIMAEIIASSPNGGSCRDRYCDFIEGNGFREGDFSEYIVNSEGDTADDILQLVCKDVADHEGFSLHINYNMLGQIAELYHIPFMSCRMSEEDSNGYIGKIAIHPDWAGKKSRNGKVIKVNKETVDYIDVFNPKKEVVMSQIQAVGGIDKYKGQILWVSLEGKNKYPLSLFDKIATELSTDEAVSNIKYRNARTNFLPYALIITKKGQSLEYDKEGKPVEKDDDSGFSDSLVQLQGDVNANKLMEVTLNDGDEEPKIVKISGNNYDKEFTVTYDTVVENIYCAFNQEPWYCIRKGKIGFGGEVMEDAFEIYNSFVSKKRRVIERAFNKVFRYWYETPNPSMDFSIEPLKYVRNANTASNNS